MAVLTRIAAACRRHGIAGFCRQLAARCTESIAAWIFQSRDESIFVKKLAPRAEYRPTIGLRVTALQPAEIGELQAFIARSNVSPFLALQRLRFSLRRGYHGLLARYEGRIVGYTWFATPDALQHPQAQLHSLHLCNGDIFAFDLFVDPTLRRRPAGLEFLVQSEEYVFARGHRTAYSIVSGGNRRSSWVHHLAGWQRWERPRNVRVFLGTVIRRADCWQRYDRRWF